MPGPSLGCLPRSWPTCGRKARKSPCGKNSSLPSAWTEKFLCRSMPSKAVIPEPQGPLAGDPAYLMQTSPRRRANRRVQKLWELAGQRLLANPKLQSQFWCLTFPTFPRSARLPPLLECEDLPTSRRMTMTLKLRTGQVWDCLQVADAERTHNMKITSLKCRTFINLHESSWIFMNLHESW